MKSKLLDSRLRGNDMPVFRRFLEVLFIWLSAFLFFLANLEAAPIATTALQFEDVTEKLGLRKHLQNWELGHAAAWGDADNDGRPDLFVGAFAHKSEMWTLPNAPHPNMLFLNKPEGFSLSDQKVLSRAGREERASSSIFVDLDNDGDLDLVVGLHNRSSPDKSTLLFENTGTGSYREATPKQSDNKQLDWPTIVGVRNVAPVDLNNDGLLDLIFCDGSYGQNRLNPRWRPIALLNKGNLQFENVSESYGFTPIPGQHSTSDQGLAVGDVNDDGKLDFFFCGTNRLYISNNKGVYHESQIGQFSYRQRDSMYAGAAFGDLNGDGRLDLAITLHGQPSRIRIFQNHREIDGGAKFEEVTKQTGMDEAFPSYGTGDRGNGFEAGRDRGSANRLPIKQAHIALRDADNDGRTDIFLSVIRRDETGRIQPVVLRNLGNDANGIPTFSRPPNKQIVGYYAAAPVADFDGDGRLDIFLCNWFTGDAQGYLFRNITKSGNWLQVKVEGQSAGFNKMGIGATVRIYEAGHAGEQKYFYGRQDIAIGTGYSSGDEAIAYFGLNENDSVNIEVTWRGRKETVRNAKANQRLIIAF